MKVKSTICISEVEHIKSIENKGNELILYLSFKEGITIVDAVNDWKDKEYHLEFESEKKAIEFYRSKVRVKISNK